MTKKKGSLPKPPASPFSPARRLGPTPPDSGELLADRLALAAAAGKLEDALENAFPGNENARKLAEMMAGLTGVAPGIPLTDTGTKADREPGPAAAPGSLPRGEDNPEPEPGSAAPDQPGKVPDDVLAAVSSGDARQLMGLLAAEYRRRSGTDAAPGETGAPVGTEPEVPADDAAPSGKVFEKETLDEILRISRENSVSPDWLISRALALYVRDYKLTGRL